MVQGGTTLSAIKDSVLVLDEDIGVSLDCGSDRLLCNCGFQLFNTEGLDIEAIFNFYPSVIDSIGLAQPIFCFVRVVFFLYDTSFLVIIERVVNTTTLTAIRASITVHELLRRELKQFFIITRFYKIC